MNILLGTRGSELAKWQSEFVANLLKQADHTVEIVVIQTRGDREANSPLSEIGGQGAFTKEIQHALLKGEIDAAVHSLKDLPAQESPGLALVATPCRVDPADALISRGNLTLAQLPTNARVGSSSARRAAQLLRLRSDLEILPIRGNVPTRIQKLDDGEFDAIVLAVAGLTRLGLSDRITERLDPSQFLPAAGQGALAVECRIAEDSHSQQIQSAVAAIQDEHVNAAICAERTFLHSIEAGCTAPVGALATIDGKSLTLSVEVLSQDGKQRIAKTGSGSLESPEDLGKRLAEECIACGAKKLIQ